MLKNGIFCEMVVLVVFKGFLLVKNLEILIQIAPERSIYYYSPSIFLVLHTNLFASPTTKSHIYIMIHK